MPKIHTQEFTIHAELKKQMSMPLVYALLADKSKETYQRVFQKVKEWVPAMATNQAKLKRFVCDFERGLINAVKSEFDHIPNLKIDNCNFHFLQCQGRQLPTYDKKLEMFHSEAEFQVQFKLFGCLAYIPVNQVERIHELMMENLITFEELRKFDRVYFKKTWIRDDDATDGTPMFPIEDWNVNERYLQFKVNFYLSDSFRTHPMIAPVFF